tara:strand:- start:146 stop:436 length:291 start_codon:yes stop_codon:yes gene_type:complete
MITKIDAILELVPNPDFHQHLDHSIEWFDEREMPSEEAIQAKQAELQADYDAKQYQRNRLIEYPSIEECVHAILDNDLEALQAKRAEIKAKYPKPE